jgi:hypothetical protein
MKFILFLEGATEEKGVPGFINRWLSQFFAVGVGVQADTFEGWSDLHDSAPKKAARYLTDARSSEVIAVISLLDLYGPTFYPADKASVSERYAWGVEYMEDHVRQRFRGRGLPDDLALRYRHFFAVHETEAWFLAQPALFPDQIRQVLEKQPKAPEAVNFQAPPGKLLEQQYLQKLKRRYSKTTNARNFFPRLDTETIVNHCPYLKAMLHDLRQMALDAGVPPRGNWHQEAGRETAPDA